MYIVLSQEVKGQGKELKVGQGVWRRSAPYTYQPVLTKRDLCEGGTVICTIQYGHH